MVENVPIERFIADHRDPFDFMLKAKVPRTSRLVAEPRDLFQPEQIALPNIARYHIARNGPQLVKIMPPLATSKTGDERRIAIDKGWKVQICNRAEHFDWSNLNRDYYVQEAYKLIGML